MFSEWKKYPDETPNLYQKVLATNGIDVFSAQFFISGDDNEKDFFDILDLGIVDDVVQEDIIFWIPFPEPPKVLHKCESNKKLNCRRIKMSDEHCELNPWIKIKHPKDGNAYLGFFVVDDCIQFRKEFWVENKKYYSFKFDGETEEIPCPDFYKEINKEPRWMEDL